MRKLNSVVLAGAICGLLLAACGSSKVATSSTTTTAKKVAIVDCPLTGTRAPGNVVPQRAPIAMKVDNYSLGPVPAEARPQSGLDYADIIFEEQVEGAITRYAAVFQCHNAPRDGRTSRCSRSWGTQFSSTLVESNPSCHSSPVPPSSTLTWA